MPRALRPMTRARAGRPTAARFIFSPTAAAVPRCGVWTCRGWRRCASPTTRSTSAPSGSPRAADRLAVSMEVFPDCDSLKCTQERLEQRAKDKARGRLYERIFIRHWDSWSDGTRAHLFTAALSPAGFAGVPVDVTRGFDADIPGKPFGDDQDYAFSPDGRRLAFSARIAARSEPWSTNFDVYETPVDASTAPVNLTANNPAWDAQPHFLANGDLVWLAQDRPGFESDRFHIVVKDARSGAVRALTGGWDRLGRAPRADPRRAQPRRERGRYRTESAVRGRCAQRRPAQAARRRRGGRLRRHGRARRVRARRSWRTCGPLQRAATRRRAEAPHAGERRAAGAAADE